MLRKKRKVQFIVVACLWLSVVASLYAQPGKPSTNNPDLVFARAVPLPQACDWENAIKEYQAFLAERPDRTDARANTENLVGDTPDEKTKPQ